MMNKIDKLWFLIPTGLLLLALFPLPYGYYQFLRIAVAVASGFIAYSSFSDGRQTWAITFGAICILFNPIIPIHLAREIWAPVDFVAAVIFLAGWKIRTRS